MVSDKFMVNSDAGRMAAARYAADNFAWQAHLDRHNTLRLNLLVEETLGMVKSMVDEFYGQLWFVGDGSTCQIHLEATANMDGAKKRELLSMSRSGTNASARGFMSGLGQLVSNALYNFSSMMDAYGKQQMKYGIVSNHDLDTPVIYGMSPVWTLHQYRIDLESERKESSWAEEAWLDLQRSIVARLADDVIVGVKGDRVELVIVKKFES